MRLTVTMQLCDPGFVEKNVIAKSTVEREGAITIDKANGVMQDIMHQAYTDFSNLVDKAEDEQIKEEARRAAEKTKAEESKVVF